MRNAIDTNYETSSHSRYRLLGTAALLALALPACIGDSETGEPLLETVAASQPASEFGISSWQVKAGGEESRIIGVDPEGAHRAEVIVRRGTIAPDDRVQIEAVFPQHGVFELARGGIVEGAPTDLLRRLGLAINADLGERSVSLPSIRSDGLGLAHSAITTQLLQASGTIVLNWSLFGYRDNINVDSWCGQGTRDHYDAYAPGGSSCWVNRWNTDSPYDCTINLHYGIGGGHTDTCNWSVYTNL